MRASSSRPTSSSSSRRVGWYGALHRTDLPLSLTDVVCAMLKPRAGEATDGPAPRCFVLIL